MKENLIDIFININENKIEISNKGENFNCKTIIYINDNFKWIIENDFISTNPNRWHYTRWHKPNTIFNNIVKVQLIEKKQIKDIDIDPYGEEIWDDIEGDILLEKIWRVNRNVEVEQLK
jgi:hypothetical protein